MVFEFGKVGKGPGAENFASIGRYREWKSLRWAAVSGRKVRSPRAPKVPDVEFPAGSRPQVGDGRGCGSASAVVRGGFALGRREKSPLEKKKKE